jgi:hypothetical protein
MSFVLTRRAYYRAIVIPRRYNSAAILLAPEWSDSSNKSRI